MLLIIYTLMFWMMTYCITLMTNANRYKIKSN